MVTCIEKKQSYPECKLLQTLGQTREGLEASAGLCNQCEGGGRASEISTRELGTGSVAGLVGKGTRSGSYGGGGCVSG